jgi:hypothetical protein
MWTDHLNLLEANSGWASRLSHITSRSANVLSQINSAIAPIAFSITSPDPQTVGTSMATIVGNGWVDVRAIRVDGVEVPVLWTDNNSWSVDLPVGLGPNIRAFEAINFSGEVVGSDSITVNNISSIEPASGNNLVISEFMYHPADPSTNEINAGFIDADLFEYIELMNIGESNVDLDGSQFSAGITHALPATNLMPGSRVVLARDRDAMLFRYPGVASVLLSGEYFGVGDTNQLSNSGEQIVLTDALGQDIRRFTYDEDLPWPNAADGVGFSLELIQPGTNPDHSLALNWRSSGSAGGTPGATEATTFSGDPNGDDDGDGLNNLVDYALGNTDAPSFLPENDKNYLFSFQRNLLAEDVLLTVESSPDLITWGSFGLQHRSSMSIGAGLERQIWELDSTLDQRLYLRLKAIPR